jgi:ligand-binding sensor domain-containing protein
MKPTITLLIPLLTFFLSLSCTEKKADMAMTASPQSDTLKFTSGIRAIFHDSKGNYWFGSLQEGVAVYNGKAFTYFNVKDGLSDNQIHSIQEDAAGTIWFNTQSGVSSFDGQRMTNQTKVKEAYSYIPPNLSSTQSEWMKHDSDLWFEAGTRSGVYRYDGHKLQYLDLPPQKALHPSDNLFAVTDISIGKSKVVWFATYAGVFGYNGKDFHIITDETLGYDRIQEGLHIRSILEDSKGRLWIGNNNIGVLLKEGDVIVNFSDKHHLIHSNSKRNAEKSPPGTLEHVFVIAEDSKGNIWFGDRDGGIWKYDGKSFANYTTKDGLDHAFAISIYEDRNGELWFGTVDGGVYTFNGRSFVRQFGKARESSLMH